MGKLVAQSPTLDVYVIFAYLSQSLRSEGHALEVMLAGAIFDNSLSARLPCCPSYPCCRDYCPCCRACCPCCSCYCACCLYIETGSLNPSTGALQIIWLWGFGYLICTEAILPGKCIRTLWGLLLGRGVKTAAAALLLCRYRSGVGAL